MRLGSRKILRIALFSCKFFQSEDRNLQETKTKTIEVKVIGEPSIDTLSESEQAVFFTTLFKRIQELASEGEKRV